MTNTQNIAGFLVVLHPPELEGRHPFFYGENIIGRSESKANVLIREVSISQKHALLHVTPNYITITDLNSKNGIKINGEGNLIEREKEVVIDVSMIIYLAEVKCKLELLPLKEELKLAQFPEKNVEIDKKMMELMAVFDDDFQPNIAKNNPTKNEV